MKEFFQRKKNIRSQFIEIFFKDKNHQWINESPQIKKSFEMLFKELNEIHFKFLIKNKTYFITCEAELSCAIGKTRDSHLVLIFPELKKLLQSASYLHGTAVLAHELGHIYFQHTEKKIDPLKAQIEADEFAFNLGFGEELQEVLLEHIQSIDCRVRVSRLTTLLITQNKKIK